MLNTFSSFLGKENLLFSDLTYTLLKEFENHLSKKPRAQSLYLGELRHLFREAMLEFNTEEKTIIKSDPFIRYKVPKQVMKKGVRALTLEELMKVYHYQGKPGSRAQLARDTFIVLPDGNELGRFVLSNELQERLHQVQQNEDQKSQKR